MKVAASDRDSTSSTGSGGIMAGMKAAIMTGKSAEAPEPGSKKAVKDGSAHPHAGSSDARVSFEIHFCNLLTTLNSPVLSHCDGSKTCRRFPFTNAQSDGFVPTSLQLGSVRS